jgi:hypothetical protein
MVELKITLGGKINKLPELHLLRRLSNFKSKVSCLHGRTRKLGKTKMLVFWVKLSAFQNTLDLYVYIYICSTLYIYYGNWSMINPCFLSQNFLK